jgi:LCP family protein required for cell wall assembly
MAHLPSHSSRPRRTWGERVVLAVLVLLVASSASGAVGVAYGTWRFGQVDKIDVDLPDAADGAPRNYLVVGSDSRAGVDPDAPDAAVFGPDGGGRRSDTILIVRVNPDGERASMLSVPRDLWVPIAGTGEHQRINAAYAEGPQVLADTIQGYLGIPINHYVEVDFRGFKDLVGAIDGVPMYFERAMRDVNSGLDVLHPGCVTLDSTQALAFVRSRHLEYMLDGEYRVDPSGDLGRITRQQVFIRHAISRAIAKGFSNPVTLNRLVDLGVDSVGIDDELSASELLGLGRRFQSFSGDRLVTHTLPVSDLRTDGGAQVLALQEEAAIPVLDLFRDRPGAVPGGGAGPSGPLTEGDVSVRVLNGTGVEHHAGNVAGALERAGFDIAAVGNVSDIGGERLDRTEILFNPVDLRAADLLVRHLSAGAKLVPDEDVAAGAPILATGRDFTTVEAAALARAVGDDEPPGTEQAAAEVDADDDGDEGEAPATTTTAPVGRTPGEVPPGERCG